MTDSEYETASTGDGDCTRGPATVMRALYTKAPGGLAVQVLRVRGCLARVAILSQWDGKATGESRWVRRSSLTRAGEDQP